MLLQFSTSKEGAGRPWAEGEKRINKLVGVPVCCFTSHDCLQWGDVLRCACASLLYTGARCNDKHVVVRGACTMYKSDCTSAWSGIVEIMCHVKQAHALSMIDLNNGNSSSTSPAVLHWEEPEPPGGFGHDSAQV